MSWYLIGTFAWKGFETSRQMHGCVPAVTLIEMRWICHWHFWNYVDIFLKSYWALFCKQSNRESKGPDSLRAETISSYVMKPLLCLFSIPEKDQGWSLFRPTAGKCDLFKLPSSLHQCEEWKLKGKTEGLNYFFSLCLITACEAVFVLWH